MFDFTKLVGWIRDGLFNSKPTWQTYKDESHGWQATAMQFSVPLIVAAAVLTLLFTWMFGGSYSFGGPSPFSAFLQTLISGFVYIGLGAFLASFLAGKLGGTQNFDQAWAALTFAAIPAMLGQVLGALPGFLGGLLALAAGIWSLVMLYQALPVFLDVPSERQTSHFFATIGLIIVSYLVLGVLMAGLGLSRAASSFSADDNSGWRERAERISAAADENGSGRNSDSSDSSNDSGAGMFGFGREANYLEAASNDSFNPPNNGRVDENQVERFIHFMDVADDLREASSSKLKKMEKDEEPSLSDIFKGIKGVIGAGTAEMQAVKSGGGNWAEHEWVKKQLFAARLHKDLDEHIAHNYALYQAYEDQLKDLL